MKGKVTDMCLGREAGASSYRVLWAVGRSLNFKNKWKTLTVPSDLCSGKILMIAVTPSELSCVKKRPGSFQCHHPNSREGGSSFRKLGHALVETRRK